MKKVLLLSVATFCALQIADARKSPVFHHTNGYYRKDGTYVGGYHSGSGSANDFGGNGYGGGDNYSAAPPPPPVPSHDKRADDQWKKVLDGTYNPKDGSSKQKVADSSTITGKCIKVTDGDTLSVLAKGQVVSIRLYAVTAPKKDEPFAGKAKQFSSGMALGKTVTVYGKGKDAYEHTLGWVFVGKTCLNSVLLKNGLVRWDQKAAPKESRLQKLESEAQIAKNGLWADKINDKQQPER